MTEAGLISLVIGLPVVISAITGAIVGVINTRVNANKIAEADRRAAEADKKIEKLNNDLEYTRQAAQTQATIARENIILLGESMSNVRSDNAKLALLVNQLFNQYEAAIGHKPDVDFGLLRDMRTLEYITGPLPHLEIK